MLPHIAPSQSPMTLIAKTPQGSQIWIGDYYGATNLQLLKQNRIRSVLTTAAMLNIGYPQQAQINHKVINAYDLPNFKLTSFFEDAFQFIFRALRIGNTLVHGATGISRSAAFIIGFLIRTGGMTFAEASEFIKSTRKGVKLNEGFQNQLKIYENIAKNLLPLSDVVSISQKKMYLRKLREKRLSQETKMQQLFPLNREEKKKSYSLGPVRSLSHNIFLSISNHPDLIRRGRSMQINKQSYHHSSAGKSIRERKEENSSQKQNKGAQNIRSQMTKLAQKFLTLHKQKRRVLSIQR